MTTTQTMTCKELYECDSGFRGFIQTWVDVKRCPLELADYLMDRGWDKKSGPVQAVLWAATTPKRRVGDDLDEWYHPYPGEWKDLYWWWVSDNSNEYGERARYVPSGNIEKHCIKLYQKNRNGNGVAGTITEAMVWLLDNWIPTP